VADTIVESNSTFSYDIESTGENKANEDIKIDEVTFFLLLNVDLL